MIAKPDLSGVGNAWKAVLEGYSRFLGERRLTLPKRRPDLVRWVREFLVFASEHPGYALKQTLDLFPVLVAVRRGMTVWQIRQALVGLRVRWCRHRAVGRAADRGEWYPRLVCRGLTDGRQ